MPATISTSRSSRALETGAAKLWMLLVGVNQYEDEALPSLRYSAVDCQGLSEALETATQAFPNKTAHIHHDFAESPNLATVRTSLQQITAAAKPQDTVLFYFSGHGILDADRQQAVLCLADTWKAQLAQTGLALEELLQALGNCSAHQQIVWLDACHSGGMTLKGARGQTEPVLLNPNMDLVQRLRQRAAQSQGFYALLSCDQAQRSWEFPELGHGVFTYFLMRGLRGEAVDSQGFIEADGLYKYVYHQTLQYIDKTNQQIRLINQQKSGRGETQLQSEYPIQTPKRIVEGIGELILGVRSLSETVAPRQALIIDGLAHHQTTLALSKILKGAGGFELDYFPRSGKAWSEVRTVIQSCLNPQQEEHLQPEETAEAIGLGHSDSAHPDLAHPELAEPVAKGTRDDASAFSIATSASFRPTSLQSVAESTTFLLYIRGRIEETSEGDAWLILGDGIRLNLAWLRQVLRQSSQVQQIIVLDCPGSNSLARWVEDLQTGSEQGQCLIAAAAPLSQPERFTEAILETLTKTEDQAGLTVAAWITQLQRALAGTSIAPHIWLSGVQGVIDVLPDRGAKGIEGEGLDLGLCPYMGLQAFSEENAQYFYGREALTEQLLRALNQQPVLAIVGASGSGKSSVAQAGLIAQLRQGKQIPGSQQWWIGNLRPGVQPIENLARRLVDPGSEKEKAYQKLQIEGLLYQGVEGFVQWLRTRPEPVVLLVIDQFEELFTLTALPDRQNFLDLLLGALTYAGDRFKLVLTLRADFIIPALEIPGLAKILQHSVLVPPYLTEDNYRQVMLKPAEQVGLQIEPGLVEVLLSDLNHSAGDLPLLEFVLEQLWQRRQNGQLTLQAYQQIGGLKGALERQAQAVYDSLDPDAQACAQWIFLTLTQLGEGTEDTRRRILKSDLAIAKYPLPLVERTLQALTIAKLIVISSEGKVGVGQSRGERSAEEGKDSLHAAHQDITIEVVHEILIRHWSTLRWWLEENRARLRLQRQLEQAATLWQQHKRQPDFLLRGARLAEVEGLYVNYTDELSSLTQQFIEACLADRDRAAQQIRKRLRQTQRVAVLIGALGLAALGLGGLAYRQKLLAQVEAINALDASSDALLWSNQQLEAVLTGVKAEQQVAQMRGSDQWLIGSEVWRETQLRAASTLQQAIYHTQEFDRLQGHHQQVNAISFNAKGDLLASGSDDGTVILWHENGSIAATLPNPKQPPNQAPNSAQANRITSIIFSPDGQTIATANSDRSIRLWRINGDTNGNALDIRLVKILNGHRDWVTSLSFSPDGNTIASASRDRTVKLWSLDGSLIKTLAGHKGWVNQVRFSPDGKTLASAGEDNQIRLWRSDGVLVRILSGKNRKPTDRITSLAFSPDRQHLISAGDTILRWNLATGTAQPLGQTEAIGDSVKINSVSVSPDGKIATAGSDGKINLWQPNGTLQQSFVGHRAAIQEISFSPTGDRLASASADKTVRLWTMSPDGIANAKGSIYSARFSPVPLSSSPDANSRFFATAGWDGAIALWKQTADRRTLVRVLKGHDSTIAAIAYSPDGATLASASADKSIKLWRVSEGKAIATLNGHSDGVTSLAFSPDGERVASGSNDKSVKLWSTVSGKLLATLSGHNDGVTSVAFSPKDNLLASGSYDRSVILWNSDGTLLRTLDQQGSAVAAVRFSPDGQFLAVGSWDNTIRLWQIGNPIASVNTPLRVFTGHQGGVVGLDFSADGRVLASSSADGTVKLWNLDTGTLIHTLFGQNARVNSVQFSPDQQALISADDNGAVMIWNLNQSELLNQGCDRLRNYLATNSNVQEGDRDLCN